MPAFRFFTSADFKKGQTTILKGTEYHHLVKVMRQKVGDRLELINGKGFLALTEVIFLNKKEAHVEIQELHFQKIPPLTFILAQAICRQERLETIVEKATELGTTRIDLFSSSQSERKTLSEHQLERLKTIAINATKQCGRLYLPEIVLHKDLSFLKKFSGLKLFGDIAPTAKPLKALQEELSKHLACLMLIGPESGFSEKEEERFLAEGAIGIKLHELILRSDTAAIAAMTLLTHFSLENNSFIDNGLIRH